MKFCSSISTPSASPKSTPFWNTRLLAAITARGLSVMVLAKAMASARSCARGTDFSASPAATASGPMYQREVQIISFARCSPTRRARRSVAAAGSTPESVCASP